jgi:hypothetical protein
MEDSATRASYMRVSGGGNTFAGSGVFNTAADCTKLDRRHRLQELCAVTTPDPLCVAARKGSGVVAAYSL